MINYSWWWSSFLSLKPSNNPHAQVDELVESCTIYDNYNVFAITNYDNYKDKYVFEINPPYMKAKKQNSKPVEGNVSYLFIITMSCIVAQQMLYSNFKTLLLKAVDRLSKNT